MLGTFINVAAVIAGSVIGLLLHKKLPQRLVAAVFQAIGLFTLFLGVTMAGKTKNFLVLIFSITVGSLIGELLDLDALITRFSNWLKRRLHLLIGKGETRFSEGLISAFLLFCMGSMTILGAFEEGLGGKPNLLLAKSLLDGFASIAFSAAMGIGVLFSIIPLFIYQGGLTLFASYLHSYLTETLINEMTAAGGIMLIGLGITILEIKQLKIINMIPSLVVALLLAYLFL